eukprot:m.170097 g.170097  ORF g.170097 m.170097 type:complete len:311 (+) comp39029_c2_seq15:276-1208(+)
MADSKWKIRLPSGFSDTVELLTGLVTSSNRLFDELVQASLLTMEEYEKILSEFKTPADRARQTLFFLQRRPSPSFDRFCDVLLHFPNGRGVYDILMGESPDAPSSSRPPEQSATCETSPATNEEGGHQLVVTSMAKSPQTSAVVGQDDTAALKTGTTVTAKTFRDLAEKIRRAKCFRSYFKKSDFPEDVLNTVCLSGILPVLLRTTLGLDPSLLELRPKTDIDFQKRRDIVELWIDSSGETSTLEILLDAVDKGGQWGAVSGALEEKIRSAGTLHTQTPIIRTSLNRTTGCSKSLFLAFLRSRDDICSVH